MISDYQGMLVREKHQHIMFIVYFDVYSNVYSIFDTRLNIILKCTVIDKF